MNKPIFILCMYAFLASALSQVTDIPDTNFRRALKRSLPEQYFNLQEQLIDTFAIKYTGHINCSSQNITTLSGIEKLKNLKKLDCSNNKLTDLSEIAHLTALEDLNCENNQLSQLPSFQQLNHLMYLICSNNKLNTLPDFSTTLNLKKLQCNNNLITEIKGLDKLSQLEMFVAYQNKITKLPNLSALQNLVVLECHGNQLDTLIGLQGLKSLKTLSCGSNFFRSTGDLSGLVSLESIGYWANQIQQVPDLSQSPNLVSFDFNNNKLHTLPNFANNQKLEIIKCQDNLLQGTIDLRYLPVLQHVQLSNNLLDTWPLFEGSSGSIKELYMSKNSLSTVPELSNYWQLQQLSLDDNHFTFEDLSPLRSLQLLRFMYTPQKHINVPPTMTAKVSAPFTWVLNIDKHLHGNSYEWYKDGQLLATSTNDTFKIAAVDSTHTGSYRCIVKNNQFSNLVLHSNSFMLQITSCLDIRQIKYEVQDITCGRSGSVKIDPASIISADPNMIFSLRSLSTGKTTSGTIPYFDALTDTEYLLSVSTATCSGQSTTITLQRSFNGCEGIIVASGEDPSKSNFYIEESGEARIYNKDGILVKKLSAPAYWNGAMDNGNILPGLYIIEVNSKFLSVTVLK